MPKIKITCVSDLHGQTPDLPGGDLLILAGDYTGRGKTREWNQFFHWLDNQEYRKKILIAGNHDNIDMGDYLEPGFDYLCDSGDEFEGLKIWGCPWTPMFHSVNPSCMHYMDWEYCLGGRYKKIPKDTDILVTHGPPKGILDEARNLDRCGSETLYDLLYSGKIRPKLHIFGHIHEAHGEVKEMADIPGVHFINCSLMNRDYEPVNSPINLEIDV